MQITQNFSNADVQAATSSEIVVRKADKNLRQTENSQLELRIFRVYQPLTSKISENKKFLRQPPHTTIVDSNFMARAFRTKPQTHRPAYLKIPGLVHRRKPPEFVVRWNVEEPPETRQDGGWFLGVQ